VKLNADHSGVCKFGKSQTDLDNLKLVKHNIRDVFKQALKRCELKNPAAVSFPLVPQGNITSEEDLLRERFNSLGNGN